MTPKITKYLKYPKIKIEFQKTAFFSVVKILIDIVFSNNFQTIYLSSMRGLTHFIHRQSLQNTLLVFS